MPGYKIAKSLHEPVTVEVEGGQTFVSVPLSPSLIRAISKIEAERTSGAVDDMTAVVGQVALIFGVKPEAVEVLDIRVLNQILQHATEAMAGGKASKADAEATAEKNAPEPGPATTQ